MTNSKEKGFSLIELIVVIAIIGVLSTILMVSLNVARSKAQIAKAKSEIVAIRSAMAVMVHDVNLWPNGCPVDEVVFVDNELELTDPNAGLLVVPTVGPTVSGCEWTDEAVSNWGGPYVTTDLIDPWGETYWIDHDYYPKEDCPTANANAGISAISVIVSHGPNGTGGADSSDYDCDDVYIEI